MKRKMVIVVIIMVCVFAFAENMYTLELSLEKSYKLGFGSVGNMIRFYDDYFYIADWQNTKLYVYDKDFKVKACFLERGKGPGEISGNIFYTEISPKGLIYVFDPMTSCYHVYHKMTYQDSFNLGKMMNRFIFLDEERALFTYTMNPQKTVFAEMNINDGKIIRELDYKSKEKGNSQVIEGQVAMAVHKDDLYFGYMLKNKLYKYSLTQDKVVKETELPFIKTTKTSSDQPFAAYYILQLCVYHDNILILSADFKGKKMTETMPDFYFYIFDADLKFIERIKLDKMVQDFCLVDDFLYVTSGNRVYKYKLTDSHQ